MPGIGYSSGSIPFVDPANILAWGEGVSNGGGATVLTVPAGRIWQGVVSTQLGLATNAAAATGSANAYYAFAGTGVIPNVANFCLSYAFLGADGSTGLDGQGVTAYNNMPLTLVAPAANAVALVSNANASSGVTAQMSFSGMGVLL